MRGTFTSLFILVLANVGFSQTTTHPYVSYDFIETRHNDSDHRECITQIFLTADDYVGYRYREDVYGSTSPTVQSVEFSNEYKRKATAEEQAELVQALIAAKIFDLTSEPERSSTHYRGSFNVRIDTRETVIYFYSPDSSPGRKAIQEVITQFAKRMKVDHPAEIAKATTITEGDRQPARSVDLAAVLSHPDEYHGKRVSVVGFYHGEFEGESLSVDEAASCKRDYKRSVWRSGPSTFAEKSAINGRNDTWLRVEGIFLKGPGGHMGLWPGELVRLTRIEPVPKPKK